MRGHNNFRERSKWAVLLAATTSFSSVALAQTAPPGDPALLPDENGVNMINGDVIAPSVSVSIGTPGNGGLEYKRTHIGNAWTDNMNYQFADGTWTDSFGTMHCAYSVTLGEIAKKMDYNCSGPYNVFTPEIPDGSTLTQTTNSHGYYDFTYTAGDGTTVFFPSYNTNAIYSGISPAFIGSKITKPNGEIINNNYIYYYGNGGTIYSGSIVWSVTNNYGHQIKFNYSGGIISSVQAINNSVDYCDPFATTCTGLTISWPQLTFTRTTSGSNTIDTVTEPTGITTTYTANSFGQPTSIARAGTTLASYQYDPTYFNLTSITNLKGTWGYGWNSGALTRTDPLGHTRSVTADYDYGQLQSYTDELGRKTTWLYDTNHLLQYFVPPDGTITSGTPTAGYTQYQYDSRGNVTQTTRVPKTGSYNLTTSAGYDTTCGNTKTCNQPNWTKDERAFQTDYTYDSTHGGTLTVTMPAPSTGAPRPQMRYIYTPLQAYYKTSSGGTPVASGLSIYKLTTTSTCLNSASCTGAAEEQKTTLGYGTFTSGTPNNLYVVSKTIAAGDNSVSAASTMTYNNYGDMLTVDGPAPGSGDTTSYKYDAGRRLVGVVGPLPNGASLYLARRYAYDSYGYKYLDEQGTVASQSDADWANFSLSYHRYWLNNADGRPIRTTVWSNNVDYAVRDFVYDGEGRISCTIDYMNPSNWGPYASSCTPLQTNGPYGPDRVTQFTYDVADRVTQVGRGVGTASVATEVTAYTPANKVDYVIDAKNNRTTYEYDGFNRLTKARYPLPTQGSNSSSTTDYELLTYGDNVNVTSDRLRDGTSTTLTYDNLNRLVSRTPQSENTVNYSYNLLDMPTQAYRPNDGVNVSYTFDALGRKLTEGQSFGSVNYLYDDANNRIKMTWNDGFYVYYDHDNAGNIMKIRENGATSGVGVLATYSYDNYGRRSSVTYGNGTTRTYAYDAIDRLKGLQIDLPGTSNDLVIGQVGVNGTAISYNPLSQIYGVTRSNNAYAYTGRYNVSRSYTTNGLNQYTASGSVSLGYDTRGNLTSSGTSSYTYNKLNLLGSAPGGVTMYYDSLDRLTEYDTNVSTRSYYSGSNLVAEVSNPSGSILRRFVPGPDTDEPVVWYEGSGTTDRRFMQADERGSVIAISDSSGNAIGINRYDEYGIPAASNVGRFQYTGQTWYPELGMYNYKARIYSPTLGRFMQTDIAGYGDGLNWYNYAKADPVNGTDPSGTWSCQGDAATCDALKTTGLQDFSFKVGNITYNVKINYTVISSGTSFSLPTSGFFSLASTGIGSFSAGPTNFANEILVRARKPQPVNLDGPPLEPISDGMGRPPFALQEYILRGVTNKLKTIHDCATVGARAATAEKEGDSGPKASDVAGEAADRYLEYRARKAEMAEAGEGAAKPGGGGPAAAVTVAAELLGMVAKGAVGFARCIQH